MTDKSRGSTAAPAGSKKTKNKVVPRKVEATIPESKARMLDAVDYVLREHADVLERLSKR